LVDIEFFSPKLSFVTTVPGALTNQSLHGDEGRRLGRLQDRVEELQVGLLKVRPQDLHLEEEGALEPIV
jgi:hypothetical protein